MTRLLSLNDLHSSSKILAGYTSRLADLGQRLIIGWSEKHWPIRATWLWEKNNGFSQSLSAHGCSSHMFHIFSRMALSENGLAASPFHFIIMFPIRWLFGYLVQAIYHFQNQVPVGVGYALQHIIHVFSQKKGIALSIAPKTWLLLSSSIH